MTYAGILVLGFPAGFPAEVLVDLAFGEPWKTGLAADMLLTSELSGVFGATNPEDSEQ